MRLATLEPAIFAKKIALPYRTTEYTSVIRQGTETRRIGGIKQVKIMRAAVAANQSRGTQS